MSFIEAPHQKTHTTPEGVVEFIADPNVDPAHTVLAAGLSAVSSTVEIVVVDEQTGNALHMARNGQIEHGSEEAGKYVVSLGKSYIDERGDRVADVEVSSNGEMDPTAQVLVGNMPEGFIPAPENMPEVEFSIQDQDIVDRLLEGQIFIIRPETPALAALATAAHLLSERAGVDINDGHTHIYSHLTSS